jgi:hypothetical protein
MTDAQTSMESWMRALRMSLTDVSLALHGNAVPGAVPPRPSRSSDAPCSPRTMRSTSWWTNSKDQAPACKTRATANVGKRNAADARRAMLTPAPGG